MWATRGRVAAEEFGDEGEGALGGGEADAVGALVGDGVEALEGEGEVGSALVGDEGVDFIDDDGVDVAQSFAAAGGGEQDVERLRGGDEDVRRQLQHAGAVAGGSVSGADHGADGGHEIAAGGGELLDFGEGLVEVLLHVVAESFEGRDVEDLGALAKAPVRDWRTRESMQARKAARVLPLPVGAEMSVLRRARMCGQPAICGSVGVPKRAVNHSRTTGCAQERGSSGGD